MTGTPTRLAGRPVIPRRGIPSSATPGKATSQYSRYQKPLRDLIREWCRKHKLRVGCVDCGYRKNADALQFDHRPGTKKKICVPNSKNWKELFEELKKCVVRCANCHAILTHKRRRAANRKRIG